MELSWVDLSNPVSLWWLFLSGVAVFNICAWIFTFAYLSKKPESSSTTKLLLILSSAYVFGCAFRSFIPRADVQRICLFNTWFACVFIGRTVATIAEVSFIAQWAIVLNRVSKLSGARLAQNISVIIVPLIVIAECFSWYAVISTHYLGNTCEESIWTITYILIAISLLSIVPRLRGFLRMATALSIVGCVLYVTFMMTVDVPMYFGRWQADTAHGKVLLGLMEGLRDLNTHWTVTHDLKDWQTEIPWMSLYFTAAVWTSIALCYIPMTKEYFARHLRQK